jgi:hypothetical protein
MKLCLAIALALGAAAIEEPVTSAPGLVEPSSGTTFEARPSAGGETFLCVGAGVRKYLFWSVYAIDFCFEESAGRRAVAQYFAGPGRSYAALRGQALADALRQAPSFYDFIAVMEADKRAELVFLRDAGAEKIRDGFGKNLLQGIGAGAPEQAAVRAFVSVIDHDVKAGDRAELATRPGELSLTVGGRSRTLRHASVEVAIWRVYFGADSPAPSLKESVAQGVAALWR